MSRLLVACALFFLLVTTSEAHPFNGLGKAQRIASERFPGTCKDPHVKRQHGEGADTTIGWANRRTCTVTFTPRIHDLSWVERCTALAHEFGHLAGRGHHPDPDHIMHPLLSPRNHLRACR